MLNRHGRDAYDTRLSHSGLNLQDAVGTQMALDTSPPTCHVDPSRCGTGPESAGDSPTCTHLERNSKNRRGHGTCAKLPRRRGVLGGLMKGKAPGGADKLRECTSTMYVAPVGEPEAHHSSGQNAWSSALADRRTASE